MSRQRLAFSIAVSLAAAAPVRAAVQEPTRDGWVVLPVEDYRALRIKAFPPDREPDPPPVEVALTRLDYDLKIVGDAALGEARLTVDVLKEGWVRVWVPAGLRVRDARVDGRPVSLLTDSAGKSAPGPHVWLSKTGRSVLALDIALPVAAAAGTETVSLPSSQVALVRASLEVPRKGMDVTVAGGLLTGKDESSAGSHFVAHGRSGEALSFSWRRRLEERRQALPLRLRGAVTHVVGLGEDGAQLMADVALEVIQGVAPSVTLALGEGLVVNQVSGALVADWDYKPGALVVTFLEPLDGSGRIVVNGEARTEREGSVTVPLLRLVQAERETGGVAVEVLGAGEIKDRQARGLDPADPTDLGEVVAGRDAPSLVAFRFRPQDGKAPRSLAVQVSRYTPEAVLVTNVEEARYQVLASDEGRSLVRARYAVRNNQRSFLTLTLPPGATLWSASVSGRAIRPGRSAEGALLLPLEKGRAGEEAPVFPVEVVYLEKGTAWQKQGRTRLALPALDLQVSRTGLELHHSTRYRVVAEPGAFRTEPYAEPLSAALTRPPAVVAALGHEKSGAKKDLLQSEEDKQVAGEIQGLVDRYQKEGRANRVAGVLPVQVPFPAYGPSVFLVSELTADASAPAVELAYKRTKGGAR
jgi:hypothetical protein